MLYTRIKHIAILIGCCLCLTTAVLQAQVNYPVMTSVQLNPPYSLYLSDYAAPDLQRMQVSLLMKDLTEINFKCRLRLKIEGFGVTLQSKAGFYTPPILLTGGEMLTLSGADLAPYLNPQNLFIQGLDNSQFTRNGAKLPEGIYKFTIEVLDYKRNNVISNAANALISTFLSYPPIINLPMANTKVDALNPQNVVFQWMPRHTASFNAAFNVVYKFRLVELMPANRDPNDALRTTRPLLETITPQTMLVYGPGEPALTPGNNYAVQVQAIETEGRDMFINNGYSEAVPFTYGEKCSVPQNVIAAVTGHNSLKLTWTGTSSQQTFSVRYREAGDHPSQWYEEDAYIPQLTITGLKESKKYEYQIKGQCIWGYGDYTPSQFFTMPDAKMQKGDFVCGSSGGISTITNHENIPQLQVGDTITAGDFSVVISKVSGGQGSFSGTGEVLVPFLNFLSLTVTFNNIHVNTSRQMYEGIIQIMQDDPGKVTAALKQTLTDMLDKIDNALQSNDLVSLQNLDVAGLLQQISKMKDWRELSAATKEDLTNLQSKLQEAQQLLQDNNMSPEEKASLAQRIGKDIKDVANKMKQDLKEIGEVLKELLGIFRKAVNQLKSDYNDDRMQQLKKDYDQKKNAADLLIKDNNDAVGLTKGNGQTMENAGDIEELADSESADIPLELKAYSEASDSLKQGIIVQILAANTDAQVDEQVVNKLQVNQQSLKEFLDQQKKDKKEETGTVQQVKMSILDWIESIIEKL
ncbi:fibronectin type III domain protein [Chitinophaga niastensis]|uniref:Fibronectin type III domain protein n=1 Tax=Chitinophaga niastensis TaxID=536980 RepID=A0A2P8HDF8_CHINA|nr:fibronectin type III domain-containing protein [Chitinophaga niastensis]PSL44257.1 fibronectin type III domain protein [Chitinophaga niastensis]